MLTRAQYWFLSILGAVSLVLVISNIELTGANRALQSEAANRTQTLQQGIQLESLYQQIAHALGNLAVQNKDENLRAMLARDGIRVTEAGQPTASGAHQ